MREMVRLGDVGTIITGNTPKTSDKENYSSKDIPFIKPSDISETEISTINCSEYYIAEQAKNKARIIPINSILVTCIGIIGKIGINKIECAFNQQINSIIPDLSKCISEYLAYAIYSRKLFLQNIANAPVVPILNKSQFSDIEIPLPPLPEQRRIAAVLDKVSELIALRKKQLALLDEMVKARFVEMFGDPVRNEKGWEVNKLKELSVLITNGNTPKGGSENYVKSGIIFLRSQNIWRNRIDLSDVAFIDEATNKKMKRSIVKQNDILITKTGRINTENSSLGRAALFLGENNSANINGHVYLVRLYSKVNPKFVVAILTSEAYRKYIRKVCVGGIDKRQINLDQLEDFPIILPPLDFQTQFADFVQQVEKSKASVQQGIDRLNLLKSALMQEYFG